MQKKILKIYFCDFWNGFKPDDLIFYKYIESKYNIEITNNDPSIVFYSIFFKQFSFDFIKYKNSTLVFICGENVPLNFKLFDYAFSSELIENYRHLRVPIYILEKFRFPNILDSKIKVFNHKKFCNFLYSNNNFKSTDTRNNFYRKLNKYKQIDSGGKVLNNIGYLVSNKTEFVKNYKFTIAFENSSYPGYTTEKIIDAFIAGSIPIYWGNPQIDKEFNSESFVNCHDYKNFNEVIERVIEIDNNEDLYNKMMNNEIYKNKTNNILILNKIEKFIDRIIDNPFPMGKPVLSYYKNSEISLEFDLFKMTRHRGFGKFGINDYFNFMNTKIRKYFKKI